MNKRSLLIHGIAFATLTIPVITFAHGGEADGHVEDVVTIATQPSGASALLRPWSAEWFGLLFVSSLITAGLSYWVYRYIQVAPVEKKETEENKA